MPKLPEGMSPQEMLPALTRIKEILDEEKLETIEDLRDLLVNYREKVSKANNELFEIRKDLKHCRIRSKATLEVLNQNIKRLQEMCASVIACVIEELQLLEKQ